MKSNFNYRYIAFIVSISALGGLLFGYDWVVIGGAKRFYEIFFGIRDMPVIQGWVMSSAIVGCLFGAISAGTVSDKYGRKKPLIFAAALFIIAAIGTGAANNLTVFAGLFFVLAFLIPESPRWLVKAGLKESASKVLENIGGKEYGLESYQSIEATLSEDSTKVDFKDLKSTKIKRIVIIGVVLAILQQWCGINVIYNYADEIFTQAGYGINDMLFNIVATGSVNLVFTFAGMVVIDRWGRRKLMLLGFGGLFILYLIFGMFYQFELKGLIMLLSVLVGIAIYAMTLAPTTWVVLSEIFPNKVRGLAMSIATLALWSGCFVITYLFPVLNKWAGASGTFWAFGAICFAGFFFVKKYLPETKGKTLEEIENEL